MASCILINGGLEYNCCERVNFYSLFFVKIDCTLFRIFLIINHKIEIMISKLKTFEIGNPYQVLGGEIRSITAEVTINKAKMADKAMTL